MEKIIRCSFDFDQTLEFEYVQNYAKSLVDRNIEVWIVTTRWDRLSKFCAPSYFSFHGNTWKEVHEVALNIGIPLKRVVFTNHRWKAEWFKDNKDFVWHLDDNDLEFKGIDRLGIKAIDVLTAGWEDKCNKLLDGI